MKENHADKIRQLVRGRYAKATEGSGCGSQPENTSPCCGSSAGFPQMASQIMGYSKEELGSVLNEVGFRDVKIELKAHSKEIVSGWFPGSGAENYVASANI